MEYLLTESSYDTVEGGSNICEVCNAPSYHQCSPLSIRIGSAALAQAHSSM